MKQEYKNFGYMLAWVVVATMLLNPTFASQISSNLVKWFVAITSSDIKAENNLVWLDAGWKTIIFVHKINYYSDSSYYTCPSWYIEIKWDWVNRADAYGLNMVSWKWKWDRMWFLVDDVFKDWCRYSDWNGADDTVNLDNLWFKAYNDANSRRCTILTSCIKIY